MNAPASSVDRSSLRLTPQNAPLFGFAAIAWAGIVAYARHMGNGAGTMGVPSVEFVGMWSVMMTAMMLPAVVPVASLYSRSITTHRRRRMVLFVGGYLLTWAVVGIPAYFGLRLVDDHVATSATSMRVVAAVVLAVGGLYQLTPMKAVCLRHCRSPLGQLLRYANVKGPARDLRVAVHHSSYCLGCCWALMALFVAFGVMNIWAMLGLAALVVIEKLFRHGEAIGRVAGVAFVALALCVALSPAVARAVVPSTASMTTGM